MSIPFLGKNLKYLRVNKNMTQTDLGKKLDLDSGYISRIENGSKIPSLDTFIKIVIALDTTPTELLADGSVSKAETNLSLIQEIKELTEAQYHFVYEQVKTQSCNIKSLRIKNTKSFVGKFSHLGTNIKKFRVKKELPMNSLCEDVHISKSHFSNIENGTKSPKLETLLKISDALEVTPFDLLLDNFNVYKELLKSIFDIKELEDLNESECKFIYENLSQMVSLIKNFT